MDRLGTKDLHEILSLVNACISSLKLKNEIAGLFIEMQRVFRSDELVFLYPNANASGIDLTHSISLQRDRSFLARYADYYWRYDPLYQAQFSPDSDRLVFRTDDIIPYSEAAMLEYYCKFLKPQNLFSELIIRLYFRSRLFGVISLLRSKNQPFFNKKDILKAEYIIPYVVNTLEVKQLFSKSIEEQLLFEEWLESQPEGIILLDSQLQPLYYNSRAKVFCLFMTDKKQAGTSYLKNEEDILIPVPVIHDCQKLLKSYQENNPANNYDNRIVNTGSKKRYHIQMFLVSENSPDLIQPCFVVVINDLSRYVDDQEGNILKEYKLTRQEAVVARYASLGLTNKEIAYDVHSSPFTIQNQLKNAFEKTGLKNRTQLAHLMKYSGYLSPLSEAELNHPGIEDYSAANDSH
jgi:DNA-binding CsgD family transcriptional regulator